MVRPKALKPPFGRSEPRVTIHEGVWYVPCLADLDQFTFPGWDSADLFGNGNDVHVEFCSGNGSWIAEKAKNDPGGNWLAVEKRFDRARKIWSKRTNGQLANLIVAHAEGLSLSTHYIPNGSVATLYVNFPDPWPKNRHAKHRIISPLFFAEAARVLRGQGKLIFVTDDLPYSTTFLQLAAEHTAFRSLLPYPQFQDPPTGYGTSFFDSLFRKQGRPIYYHELEKYII